MCVFVTVYKRSDFWRAYFYRAPRSSLHKRVNNLPEGHESNHISMSSHTTLCKLGVTVYCFPHRRPQTWARGGTSPLWKCCKVFLCISSYSKTLSRRILKHYFHNLSSASGGSDPDPHPAASLDPAGGFLYSKPLICKNPWKKILWAPMFFPGQFSPAINIFINVRSC